MERRNTCDKPPPMLRELALRSARPALC